MKLLTAKEVATYMAKRPSFMQRLGRQHITDSQTLLRSARNQFHTTLLII